MSTPGPSRSQYSHHRGETAASATQSCAHPAGVTAVFQLCFAKFRRENRGHETPPTAQNASTEYATTTLTYDERTLLTDWKKKDSGSGSLLAEFAYQYDATGNRTSMNATGTLTTFSFNAANELTRATGSTSYTDYSYDLNGNMLGTRVPRPAPASP